MSEHPKNPRKGKTDLIRESISKNDFYGAIIVQKSTNQILAGNHRWRAAKAQGLKKVPAIIVDVDDPVAMRILLADNKTSDEGSYNNEVLAEILQDMQSDTGDLFGTGYDSDDLTKLISRTVDLPEDESTLVPTHEEQTKLVHKCPKCKYEWTPREKTGKRKSVK